MKIFVVKLKEKILFSKTSEKKISFTTELIEKISDPSKTKYYQSYLNKKIVKQSKIIAQQPKNIENPNTVDIKSSISQHPKTYKLTKTIKQAERVSQIGGVDSQ